MAIGTGASAHELRPAVADVDVGADQVTVEIRLVLEPMIAGMNVAGLEDTNESPLSGYHDRLRAEDPAALDAAFRAIWPEISDGITLRAGETPLSPEIAALRIPEVGDPSLPRDSRLTLVAQLPPDGSPVVFGWAGQFGPVVVRQAAGGDQAYAAILHGGELSAPLPREAVAQEPGWKVFLRFIRTGFEHIVPKGVDHILFVLGLFFFSLNMRPLLAQVTAFTVAHTTTLALASLGIVSVPSAVVEPLIALSIVFVAVENVFGGKLGWGRIAVVFGFGLLHGLGFATMLGDVGDDSGRFFTRLIGFNIGVELGQLTVILAAWLLVGLPFGGYPWYRRVIAVPASLVIAGIGIWWTIERLPF